MAEVIVNSHSHHTIVICITERLEWAFANDGCRALEVAHRPNGAAAFNGVTSPFAQNCTTRPMHEEIAFRTVFETGFCNGKR